MPLFGRKKAGAPADGAAFPPPPPDQRRGISGIFFRKKPKDHRVDLHLTPEEKKRIADVFAKLDTNGDGHVDHLELVSGLQDMGHPNPTLETVEAMLKSVHLEGHHDVTLSEFEIMWKNKPNDGWDFASGAASMVMGLLGAAGGRAFVSGGEQPRGEPITDVHYKDVCNLGKQLGAGAFSKVYRATSKADTATQFAIKVVQKKDVPDPADVEALLEEVGILQQIHHPHIMRLYGFYEDVHEYALVTEIVEGGELFDRIVELQHYSEKVARDLVAIFIGTLDFLHSNGIVHRDLKPENLLLATKDDDIHIKIADFGFAKHVSQLLDTVCGTPDYIAPEVCGLMGVPKKERKPYTEKCDIWSAGVIVFILLAGYPPFYDDNQKKLFKKIKEGKFKFHDEYWSGVSDEAKDLISRMLTVNPDLRPTAAQLLDHPWLQSSSEVLAAKELNGTRGELKKWIARRKFKAGVKAVVAVRRMEALMSGVHMYSDEGEEAAAAATD